MWFKTLMELIKQRYRHLENPVLWYDQTHQPIERPTCDSCSVTPDIPQQSAGSQHFHLVYMVDIHLPPRVLDTANWKTYHNIDTNVTEERFSSGPHCSL
jgi:hypothetical protein